MFVLARLVTPVGVVMLVIPEQVLTLVFGEAWGPAAGMLRGLAAYAVLLPVFEHARVLLVAYGAVTRVLRARVIQLAVFLPAVVGLTWLFDAEGAGAAVAIAMIVGTAAIVREANAFSRLRFGDLLLPLVSGAVSGAAIIVTFAALSMSLGLQVLLASALAIGIEVIAILLLERQRAAAYVSWIITALRGGSVATA